MDALIKKKNVEGKSKGFKIQDPKDEKLIYAAAILFLFSMFLMAYFGFKTLIGVFEFLKILTLIIASCIGLLFLFFKSAFPMKMMEKLAFIGFGVGPLVCGLFFFLNYFISIDLENHYCTILGFKAHAGKVVFKTHDFPCETYPEACVLKDLDQGLPRRGEVVLIQLSKGLFGYKVIKKVEWPTLAPAS